MAHVNHAYSDGLSGHFFFTSPIQEAYSHVWRASSALFGEGSGCTQLARDVPDVGDRRPAVLGGGGMPQRIMLNSRPVSVLRITGAG